MTLLLYDFEFNLLAAEPKIIKSKWTIYYNAIGTFEAHLPLESELVKLIMENKYIVAVQKGYSAIIVGKELRDELIIYGRTCNWLLSKRITPAIELVSEDACVLAENIVTSAFYDVGNFSFEGSSGSGIEFECEENITSEVITDCLGMAGLGHELCFDRGNKQWVFRLLYGAENDFIISEAHRNAYDTVFSSDILDLATCGRFSLKSDSGYERTIFDGDTEKTGIYRWEAMLSGSSAAEAAVSYEKMREQSELSVKVHDAAFGSEYSLGDIVRVQIIKGAYRTTVKKRIKGIEISFAQGTSFEQPILEDL
ncbi:MAG: hypothetical protein J6C82_03635 [Clostridia bacterium]|nr:hypothetical protein [Clostridia bacterium]